MVMASILGARAANANGNSGNTKAVGGAVSGAAASSFFVSGAAASEHDAKGAMINPALAKPVNLIKSLFFIALVLSCKLNKMKRLMLGLSHKRPIFKKTRSIGF